MIRALVEHLFVKLAWLLALVVVPIVVVTALVTGHREWLWQLLGVLVVVFASGQALFGGER